MGFVVKRLLNLKKSPRNSKVCLKNQNCFDKCTFGADRTLAYKGAVIPGYSVTDLIFDPHHTPRLINFCKQRVRSFLQRKQ